MRNIQGYLVALQPRWILMHNMEPAEIDITKLRYVLYARKSTTDESRQIRSIPDQIRECMDMANRLHLRVVGKPLTETQSAKKPHQRPVFTQMIKDIRDGKYDAILSWNPDRLSRNMVEAGMIIDMIDNNQIKDMKFVTHPFTRDANGVMLLGMSFVLSKQYSDDLSQKVTRGVRGNFSEGKSPAPKHGYIRNDISGAYEPDGKNWELICDAWEMRREGTSLEDICKYLNDQGYGRTVKKDGRKISMSTKIITKMFHDPFYHGILISRKTGEKVDLRLAYNFTPATTEDTYNEVQQLSHRRLKPFNTRRRLTFFPFKAMIRCAFCGSNMVVGPSTSGTGKRYLNYRCDNAICKKENRRVNKKNGKPKRSIRAKIVLDYIYNVLENGLHLTEKEYKEYYDHLIAISGERRAEINTQIHSKEGQLKYIKGEIKERALGILQKGLSPIVKRENNKRIEELELQKEEIQEELETLRGELGDPDKERLSLEQFLNLSKNAATIVKSASPIVKDEICREIFLNFSAGVDEILSYQAKPAFEALLKTRQSTTSRGEEN